MRNGELISQIRSALRRGNPLDREIPLYLQQAVEFIENNHKLSYMTRHAFFTVKSRDTLIGELGDASNDDEVLFEAIGKERVVNIGEGVRRIERVWRLAEQPDEGERQTLAKRYRLTQVQAVDVDSAPIIREYPLPAVGQPSTERFFVNQNNAIVLLAVPPVDDSHYQVQYQAYTIWSADDDFRHPLLDKASGLLFAQTMLLFATRLEMSSAKKAQFQSDVAIHLKALLNADQDVQHTESVSLNPDIYTPSGYVDVERIHPNLNRETEVGGS